ncbi:MAG TPA: serine hydroxymethyltransferase, partial [Bacillota bacterium]|nr:serine hydroxymethyltransferase [Bacillota bacterium]
CKEEWAKKIDSAIFPGTQGGPLMHVIAAKAAAFKEALTPEFRQYQGQILKNASALAGELMKRGYKLVSGGTDNHLMLMNLSGSGITGKQAEKALDAVGITVNKNTVPFDTEKPTVTSGIRLGTPAVTTRGMKEKEMAVIAGLIDRVLRNMEDAAELERVAAEVLHLTKNFNLYPDYI